MVKNCEIYKNMKKKIMGSDICSTFLLLYSKYKGSQIDTK